MRSSHFEKEVLKLKPAFRVHSGHFYSVPVGHVLTGFAWEQPPGGMYLWKYAFPLYDARDSITLTLGERLSHPNDFMEVASRREAELAREFVRRVEPFEDEIAALADPANLALHIEAHLPLTNAWVRRAYALTLILVERESEAQPHLELLLENPYTERIPQFRTTVGRIYQDLLVDPAIARQTLRGWEAETTERLGIAK